MTRAISFGLVVWALCGVWGPRLFAEAIAVADARRPLDLPAELERGEADPVSAPEAIEFYGTIREGDACIFCVERSEEFGADPKFEAMKEELRHAVQQLSRRTEFGIVAYYCGVIAFQPGPVFATPANKLAATAFIDAMEGDGQSFPAYGGTEALRQAQQSSASGKFIVMVGYAHQCMPEQALIDIQDSNYQSTPIHTIVVGSTCDLFFFQQLATTNGGSCENLVD
ncbi:MAG: hypothetical protein KDC38_08775 [Planctomycetes bacterium]|nr:hypothetical protein [Planctomycetota bacterium]